MSRREAIACYAIIALILAATVALACRDALASRYPRVGSTLYRVLPAAAGQWVHGWARTTEGMPLLGVEVRVVKPEGGTMGWGNTSTTEWWGLAAQVLDGVTYTLQVTPPAGWRLVAVTTYAANGRPTVTQTDTARFTWPVIGDLGLTFDRALPTPTRTARPTFTPRPSATATVQPTAMPTHTRTPGGQPTRTPEPTWPVPTLDATLLLDNETRAAIIDVLQTRMVTQGSLPSELAVRDGALWSITPLLQIATQYDGEKRSMTIQAFVILDPLHMDASVWAYVCLDDRRCTRFEVVQ